MKPVSPCCLSRCSPIINDYDYSWHGCSSCTKTFHESDLLYLTKGSTIKAIRGTFDILDKILIAIPQLAELSDVIKLHEQFEKGIGNG